MEREEERERKIGAARTRRRQRRLPRGRGAVKGCDCRSRATYRTPQVQRTDREVEGSSASVATPNAVDAIDSSGGRCTPLSLTYASYAYSKLLSLLWFYRRSDHASKVDFVSNFLSTSSVLYSYLLRDKSEIFNTTLHVIVKNSGFFWKNLCLMILIILDCG